MSFFFFNSILNSSSGYKFLRTAQRSSENYAQPAINSPCLEEPSLNRKEEPLRIDQPLKHHSFRNKHRYISSYKLNCSTNPWVIDSMFLRMVRRMDCFFGIVIYFKNCMIGLSSGCKTFVT